MRLSAFLIHGVINLTVYLAWHRYSPSSFGLTFLIVKSEFRPLNSTFVRLLFRITLSALNHVIIRFADQPITSQLISILLPTSTVNLDVLIVTLSMRPGDKNVSQLARLCFLRSASDAGSLKQKPIKKGGPNKRLQEQMRYSVLILPLLVSTSLCLSFNWCPLAGDLRFEGVYFYKDVQLVINDVR